MIIQHVIIVSSGAKEENAFPSRPCEQSMAGGVDGSSMVRVPGHVMAA